MTRHLPNHRDISRAMSAAAAVAALPARAHPQAGYRFVHGDFHVAVFSDGFITLPGEILVPDATPQTRAEILSHIDAPRGILHTQCNIPLIRTRDDLILVDIGSGRKYQPSDGRLTENLLAADVTPVDFTKIVFTHAHPDHIWATLVEDGGLRFPNATYHVGDAEWAFWMDLDYASNMPAALHEFARGAQRDLASVRERAVMLKPGDDIVTGMRVLDTAGHTPRHLSLELEGDGGLLISADVATNQIVSFEHPDWTFGYDTLPDLAIRNRRRLLERAATDGTKLLGYHRAYPGVGYAEQRGGAFRFVSAD